MVKLVGYMIIYKAVLAGGFIPIRIYPGLHAEEGQTPVQNQVSFNKGRMGTGCWVTLMVMGIILKGKRGRLFTGTQKMDWEKNGWRVFADLGLSDQRARISVV